MLDRNIWNFLTVCKQISPIFFLNKFAYKSFTHKSFMYKHLVSANKLLILNYIDSVSLKYLKLFNCVQTNY